MAWIRRPSDLKVNLSMRCTTCGGSGRIGRRLRDPDGRESPATVIVPCPDCLGGQVSCCGETQAQPEKDADEWK